MTQALAGVGSLVGGLAGLFGSNSVPNYQPAFAGTQLQGEAGQAGAGTAQIQNQLVPYSTGVLPQAAQTTQGLYNNPFSSMYQQGALTSATMGMQGANNAFTAGNSLTGAGMYNLPYAQQILQTGFDPQNSLYNQQLALTQNQQNVANSQAGVGNTPYGASLADQNLQNFNINWQNNLLNRETTASQGANALLSGAGGAINTGTGIANAAPGQFLQSSAYPYSTFSGIGQGQLGALTQEQGLASNAINASNVPVNDYLSILSGMNAANQTANQTYGLQLQAQNQGFNQQMAYGNMAGAGLYGIGSGFGLPGTMSGLGSSLSGLGGSMMGMFG